MTQKILYVLNPKANDGQAIFEWKTAVNRFPTLPKDPLDITRVGNLTKHIEKYDPDIIAIAGGDGTINAICRAIISLKKKPLLSILPLGHGNGLSYCFGVETLSKAIDVLHGKSESIAIDVMKTNDSTYPYGVFNISVGFDAKVIHNSVNHRYIGVKSYVLSLIRSVIDHQENEIKFTIDHSITFNATASSLVIANCPIIPVFPVGNLGKDYVISQYAKLNDGFLDCTLFSSKYAYMSNLRFKGFKHPLYSEKGKVHFKAKHIKIEGEPFVQIDGDPVLQKEGLEIEVVPSAVTFLRNKTIPKDYMSFIA